MDSKKNSQLGGSVRQGSEASQRSGLSRSVLALALFAALFGGTVYALTSSGWLKWSSSRESASGLIAAESRQGPPLDLFDTQPIGDDFETPPRISFVKACDLDQDGLLDVVVCDCVRDSISWIRQSKPGVFEEQLIAAELVAPARVEIVDIDGDGDLDLVAAVLGMLFPSNDPVGSLVLLSNDGQQNFEPTNLMNNVARVSDVRAGDLDQDGDLDLAVTQFGYNQGGVGWLENQGDLTFEHHPLQDLAGGIHGIIADLNQDDIPDLVFLISQEIESIYVFFGEGQGKFREKLIHDANNPDFGSAGIWLYDMDQDDDLDIVYCNGDAFDYSPPRPWPWHGLQWLENLGGESFKVRRLLDFGGAVNAQAADFDDDGDLDVFVASTFNDWETPESQSLMMLENTGTMQFESHSLANTPSHIQALDIADFNGDGKLDLVTGGMHISAPYDRVERILLWFGRE